MKFAHQLSTCLLLFAVLGCQTENETLLPEGESSADPGRVAAASLRIKQTLVSGDNGGLGPMFTDTYFTYSQGQQLEKVTIPTNTQAGLNTLLYTYDEQGRLTVSRSLREIPTDNGIKGFQTNYQYTDSTIVQTYFNVDIYGNLSANAQSPNYKVTYRLNKEGLVYEEFEEGIIIWGSETNQLLRHTYENGNVVKTTILDAYGQVVKTIYYEYDDKINPFYKWSYMYGAALMCSRNNIISARTSKSEPQRTEYTYNEQGLPLTKKSVTKGAVLTYEYENF